MSSASLRSPKINTWVCNSCLRHALSKQQAHHNTRRAFSLSRSLADVNTKPRDGKLPDYPARTRFAPSPTGIMHIGGLRTALFSYLLARKTGGQFVLRIEDTDQKRFVPGAIERLCEDLHWAGLQWDEGPIVGGDYGPYQQSKRNDIYQHHAKDLIHRGAAYLCFCTQSEGTGSTAYVTSGCHQDCASRSAEESNDRAYNGATYTVRLTSGGKRQRRKYPDLIYGNIKRLERSPGVASNQDVDHIPAGDTILMKSDGTPTYHFANVVDDHLMKITHVIRGTEWMASTPLHYDLYDAFEWQPPLFAHVGLLLDKTKAKLSKRNADLVLDVRSLQVTNDILPEALCNFLVLQGWSNPTQNDVMEMHEMIHNFDLKFTTGNTVVGMEKLFYLQKQHFRRRCEKVEESGDPAGIAALAKKFASQVTQDYPDFQPSTGQSVHDFCITLMLIDSNSFDNVSSYMERVRYFFNSAIPDTQTTQIDPTTSSYKVIQDIMQRLQVFQVNSDSTSPTEVHARLIEQTDFIGHELIPEIVWSAILPTEKHDTMKALINSTITQQAVADKLYEDEGEAEKMIKAFRTVQSAVMKHLRSILCHGRPGCSISLAIGMLGAKECRNRVEKFFEHQVAV